MRYLFQVSATCGNLTCGDGIIRTTFRCDTSGESFRCDTNGECYSFDINHDQDSLSGFHFPSFSSVGYLGESVSMSSFQVGLHLTVFRRLCSVFTNLAVTFLSWPAGFGLLVFMRASVLVRPFREDGSTTLGSKL